MIQQISKRVPGRSAVTWSIVQLASDDYVTSNGWMSWRLTRTTNTR
jgi:hypothetical protein